MNKKFKNIRTLKQIKKRYGIIGVVIFIGCYLFTNYPTNIIPNSLDLPSKIESSEINLEEVSLKRVVDGDTLIVTNRNNEDLRVRLIGIDTPESVHPDSSKNTIDGDIASSYTKSQLKNEQTIYLEYDVERLDKYGRTLAYVWLQADVDPNDLNDLKEKMFNAKLISEGYAVAKKFPPNTKYATIFESLEK